MADDKNTSKRFQLKEMLASRITGGEFTYGSRFPGLHQLCSQYDASYVTVSRAMKLLEKDGYLQAHNGVGYFVSYISPEIISNCRKVNFITAMTAESPFWDNIQEGGQLFTDAGWEVHIHCCKDFAECTSLLNSPDAYNVLFLIKINWENVVANFHLIRQKAVVIGQLSGSTNITSIVSDEYETVRRCIEYFRSKNRTKTGIFSFLPENELNMLRIAAWRNIMRGYGADLSLLNRICFCPELKSNTDDQKKEVVSNWLRINKKDMDSLIFPTDYQILLDACKENSLRIPEDLAVINIAPFPNLKNSPFLTLDNNLRGHFQCALDIFEERIKTGRGSAGVWNFVPPGDFF